MKKDDSFAPRPTSSRNAKLIRGCALLYAIGLNLLFIWVYHRIYTEAFRLEREHDYGPAKGHIAALWSVVAVFHALFLILSWRCYLLRRWACALYCASAWMFWFQQLQDRALDVGASYWILMAFGCLALMVFTSLLKTEWHNLKKGF